MKNIGCCLWFDIQAEEAAKFYTSLFKNSKLGKVAYYNEPSAKASGKKSGSAMTVEFELDGLKVLGLNGGPQFKLNPAFSFFVNCETVAEIEVLWKKLSDGGHVRMPLGTYPWAEKYAFTSDKYGVAWQLILHKDSQKIVPAFLFVEQLLGKGEQAIQFYTSVFKNSEVKKLSLDENSKTVLHAQFLLNGQEFILMEGQGKHDIAFNNAFSLVVPCETQEEIDHLWAKLTADGGSEQPCGWLQDKYGVSWQIVPAILAELMTDKDPKKSEQVMAAILTMKKLDIQSLLKAAR